MSATNFRVWLRRSPGNAQPRCKLLLFGSYDCEHSSLGIHAKDDPQVTGHLVRSHEHLAVLLLNASVCGIDIFHVEIVEPERYRRILRIARHHGADRSTAVVENSVSTHW